MVKFLHIVLLISLIALAVPLPTQAAAQVGICDFAQGIEWRETGTQSFSILFPQEYAVIGQRLSARQGGQALDREYARFAVLFGASLPLPVSIRIYPDIQSYTCLNAQVDEIHPEAIHAHTGNREIALIGDNILANFASWAQNDINLIRYELGSLFTRQTTGATVPPGLVAAVGRYTQDPEQTIGYLQLNWNDWLEPTYDWRSLWEDDAHQADLSRQLQSTSTVAYLVDIYGWDTFLKFLQSLPAARSYPQALEQSYGEDVTALEAGWRSYYPRYFQGRWQSHVIFNFDLSPYEELIRREEYREADRRLQDAIVFIQKMQNADVLRQALLLQHMAKVGQEAEYLWGQSQQAFQAGNYPGALDMLDQAELKYAEAGNRMYHLDEFSGYRDQVRMVLVMHGELEALQFTIPKQWNTFAAANRLVAMGRRFNELGDMQGHARVLELAKVIENRQQEQYLLLAAAVIMIVVILMVIRILLFRKLPPPEAQL